MSDSSNIIRGAKKIQKNNHCWQNVGSLLGQSKSMQSPDRRTSGLGTPKNAVSWLADARRLSLSIYLSLSISLSVSFSLPLALSLSLFLSLCGERGAPPRCPTSCFPCLPIPATGVRWDFLARTRSQMDRHEIVVHSVLSSQSIRAIFLRL